MSICLEIELLEGSLYPFQVNDCNFNVGGKKAISFLIAENAWPLNMNKYFKIVPKQSFDLWANTNPNIFIDVLDEQGNSILETKFNSTSHQKLLTMDAFTVYMVGISNTLEIPVGTNVFNFSAQKASFVSDYFSEGLINQVVNVPGISIVKDNYGSLTYNFTNFDLIENQELALASSMFAKKPGVLTVSSSDESVFANFSQNFLQNSSELIVCKSKTSTSFTGNVTLTIYGVGIAISYDLICCCA